MENVRIFNLPTGFHGFDEHLPFAPQFKTAPHLFKGGF
jgi:hypothetical protein